MSNYFKVFAQLMKLKMLLDVLSSAALIYFFYSGTLQMKLNKYPFD